MEPTGVERPPALEHIPTDWPVIRLADAFDLRNGVNADKSAYGTGTPFINVLEAITRSHIHSEDIPGRVTLPPAVRSAFRVLPGDVVFNRTSETQEEVGLAGVYVGTDEVVFGGFVIRGRPRDRLFDPVYLGYALRARPVREQIVPMGQGGIRANIGQADLGTVILPVPPMPEQQAIAEILGDHDALVGGLDSLIDKKRGIRDGVARDLIQGHVRVGDHRGDWPMRRLGDVADIRRGTVITRRAARSGSIPVIAAGKEPAYLTDTPNRPGPTITISASGANAGYVAFHEKPIFASDCSTIEEAPAYSLRFLYECLVLQQARIYQTQAGGAQPHVHPSDLAPLEVPMPPVDEQRAIARLLVAMEAEIELLERRRAKTDALRTALADELLSGQRRVA